MSREGNNILSEKEKIRYARQITLSEIGEKGQEKLKNSKVLVIGAGGLGSPVLLYLTASGIGTIGIMDFDAVDISNLPRQVLYGENETGRKKSETACSSLKKMNENCDIICYYEKLTMESGQAVFGKYDLIIDCTDDLSARYIVNDLCIYFSIPFVMASLHKFQGQVSVFNYNNGPTYRCLFPESETRTFPADCEALGVLNTAAGITGLYQANEALKVLLNIGNILSGKLLIIDVLKPEIKILRIIKNPESELISINNVNNYINSKTESTIVKEISVSELLNDTGDISVFDIRMYGNGTIPGSEIFDENSFASGIENLQKKDKIVIVCNRGISSLSAVEYLERKYGLQNLYSLRGGMEEWMKTNG